MLGWGGITMGALGTDCGGPQELRALAEPAGPVTPHPPRAGSSTAAERRLLLCCCNIRLLLQRPLVRLVGIHAAMSLTAAAADGDRHTSH